MSAEFFKADEGVNVECPNCLEDIPATFQSLEENSQLTCSECDFIFNYDVEELKRKVNNAFRKILGNQPKDPNLN